MFTSLILYCLLLLSVQGFVNNNAWIYRIKQQQQHHQYSSTVVANGGVSDFGFDQPINFDKFDAQSNNPLGVGMEDGYSTSAKNALLPTTKEDMKKFAFILANVTTALETDKVENAISVISYDIGWLFARDIPALTNMLLKEYEGNKHSNT